MKLIKFYNEPDSSKPDALTCFNGCLATLPQCRLLAGETKDMDGVRTSSRRRSEHLLELPVEVLQFILTHISISDLIRIGCVCRRLRELSSDSVLWKKRIERDMIDIEDCGEKGIDYRQKCINHFLVTKNWVNQRGKSHTFTVRSYFISSTHFLAGTDTGAQLYVIGPDSGLTLIRTVKTSTVYSCHYSHDCIICFSNYDTPRIDMDSNDVYLREDTSLISVTDFNQLRKNNQNTFSGFKLKEVCAVNAYFVWILFTGLLVYDRRSYETKRIYLSNLVSVSKNSELVFTLQPDTIQVYEFNGSLVKRISQKDHYYTGLVSSQMSLSYLSCEDFSDPFVVHFDLKTGTEQRLTSKKCYKLALHLNHLILLSTSSSNSYSVSRYDPARDVILWETHLTGSKYMRPGQSHFRIINSSFVFIFPATYKFNAATLIDLNSGATVKNLYFDSRTFQCVNSTFMVYEKTKHSKVQCDVISYL